MMTCHAQSALPGGGRVPKGAGVTHDATSSQIGLSTRRYIIYIVTSYQSHSISTRVLKKKKFQLSSTEYTSATWRCILYRA